MTRQLKLMPDYECFALWDVDSVENIDPASLPISDELKDRIGRWESAYDYTLNQDDPTESGFQSTDDEESFDLEGRLIWKELKNELGESFEVKYFSIVENALL
ncbi:MAG: hypothetical protein HWE27_11110 [Gammaproteobacteria bacterium]|nr:hypothetical protein [Gammaproteobacteria bacterium]